MNLSQRDSVNQLGRAKSLVFPFDLVNMTIILLAASLFHKLKYYGINCLLIPPQIRGFFLIHL